MTPTEFAAAQRTRATGAGVDPHEYQRITDGLTSVADWGPAFLRTGHRYLQRAEDAGSVRSAGEYLLAAARWFHLATLAPYAEAHRAAVESDHALSRALTILEPGARRVSGEGFTGWLRGPSDAPGTVVVVPGLDSAKEEFLDLVSALLDRGLAVFAMDGPGQGVLAAGTTFVPDYERVVGRAIDALGVTRIGLVGLSLGGYFAARAAALDPRVAAVATVSGPFRLEWEALPQPVRDIMAQRAGGAGAAQEFVQHVDLAALAPRIAAPLLVVDGGQDVIPGVTNGEFLARLAPHGTYLSVPHGDHLLGNARPDWLPHLSDHIAHTLTGTPA
ncbi:pimeloyl-ACP methyl ester carboxylesterase [Streptomyces achromogenes]|uniref:Pimeloyl-ACP methyl ester carboxylesterase n=1 Tax=Streptomyces achromogenes TaxID=67255 RepID=A0ABU0PUB1_STRAH|nr:alpha/beta hydrolase [Streptomyces achromogenes]MDQ0681238.1 pimeloyl-ACP methyl ester carboxylesterase [Streptomyces achromogenes]MDQ0828386.1 pimeloyl-ACP methyl ester carboxylesterase [Streptomyces achromogenes]